MTIYSDADVNKDYSYYGNGCWGNDSITPCESRIEADGDGENQNIGTYYSFQAATSGSGAAISTTSANSPDTFCPLGWQLPYSGTDGDYYDKSRSWNYLFDQYGMLYNDGNAPSATMLISYPLSYINSGAIYFSIGKVLYKSQNVLVHSGTIGNAEYNNRMNSWSTAILTSNLAHKSNGAIVRCDF